MSAADQCSRCKWKGNGCWTKFTPHEDIGDCGHDDGCDHFDEWKPEVKCGNCRNFSPFGRDDDGTRVGFCCELAHQTREDWKCDGKGFHAKKEVRQ